MKLKFPIYLPVSGHHLKCEDETELLEVVQCIIDDREKDFKTRRMLFAGEWTEYVQAIDPKISNDEAWAMLCRFEQSLKYNERLLQRDAGDELMDELKEVMR